MGRVRQHLQAEAGDACQPHRAGQAVVVLARVRPARAHDPLLVLLQKRALAGFQPPFERVPGIEAAGDTRRLRLQPVLEWHLRLAPRCLLQRAALLHKLARLRHGCGCERRLVGEVGFGPFPRLPILVNAVEESRHPVVVRMAHGIELVRVALRAAECEAEPDRACRVHAVQHIIHARLLRIAPALAVGHVVAVEACRQLLLRRRLRQQVARELEAGELVKGHVVIERARHPVTPGPVRARGIRLEAVRVRVARRVQPPHRQALAEMRRGQQAVGQALR